jgi:hypothetical protein
VVGLSVRAYVRRRSCPNLYVAQEICKQQFRIAGGKPSIKVSWKVTAARNDACEQVHAMQVEVEKPGADRGYYFTLELHGAPPEKSIEWARHPQLMKRRQEMQEKAK